MKRVLIPFLFLLTASSVYAATISWTDTSNNEDGFIIEKKSGTSFAELGRVGSNVTTYPLTMTTGESACYRVLAYNAAGNSAPSNEACLTVPSKVTVGVTLEFGGTLQPPQ